MSSIYGSIRIVRPLVPLAVALSSCAHSRAPAADPVALRIERVTTGLRPPVLLRGRPPARWTLARRMEELHVPGVEIALIDSGRIAWARGFGVKEAGGADSVTAETLFQAQSISKPVAVTAMLQLAEAGRVSLDEDVDRYLVSWKLPVNRFTRETKVTLRRIASHSAGINNGGFAGYVLGDSIPTLTQILDGVRPANSPPVRVDTVPGTIWRYSGGGMLVMQQLMVDVTGEPFAALMKRAVLDPAAMTRSSYEQPLPSTRRAEAATGHDSDGTILPGKWRIQPELAAAGLWTTTTDLARWALAIAAAWRGERGSILSPEMARAMLTMQQPPSGLGVMLAGTDSSFRFEHSGANRGFRAELVMFPARGQGAVILTNADRGGDLIDPILQSIAAEYDWPAYRQVERSPATVGARALDLLAGTYLLGQKLGGRAVYVTVRRAGDTLLLSAPPFLPRLELYPAAADSFFDLNGSTVTFARDSSGRGAWLNLGPDRATRVEKPSSER